MIPSELLDAWNRAGLGAHGLPCGDGSLVGVRRGARAVPFDERGRPLLWLAPEVMAAPRLADWVASGAWNFGAERLWLCPEIRFMVHDRADFDGSYVLPAAMDPGDWSVETGDHSLLFRQRLTLQARHPTGQVDLAVEQRIRPLADPLRRQPPEAGLRHLGWTREVRLTREAADSGTVACQAWALIQVEAGGSVAIPGAARARLTDYFEPIDDDHISRKGGALRLELSGRKRFKVGIRTGEHRGQLAWQLRRDGGEDLLIVRRFLDLPGSRYLEQPPDAPDHEGDSAFVYNDDGRHGKFGELEALGRALEVGDQAATDLFELHCWWGPAAAVSRLHERSFGDLS